MTGLSELQTGGRTAMTGLDCRLDHLGIAVSDLGAAIDFYQDILRCRLSKRVEMPDQGLSVAMMQLQNTRVELLAPAGDNSPLAHLLEDRTINDFIRDHPEGGFHHMCFAVPDMAAALSALVERGGRVLGDGKGVIGVDGSRVVFLDPSNSGNVLIELKQPG